MTGASLCLSSILPGSEAQLLSSFTSCVWLWFPGTKLKSQQCKLI